MAAQAHVSLFEVTPGRDDLVPGRDDLIARTQLAKALRDWDLAERASWDERVTDDDSEGAGLWADMPAIDSKTVARMAPLFKTHLGETLDVSRIRCGGYSDIEDVIRHLVLR